MGVIERFYIFLNSIFSHFAIKKKENTNQGFLEQFLEENVEESFSSNEKQEKINVSNRTIMSKLYTMEQEIVIFKDTFPKDFKVFKEKIELLREKYISSLKELDKDLTYEIDPDIDGIKIGEVVKLERDIKKFIECEVNFDIISKRLQQLILKLNILYNVSIFHSKECEKEKVMSQVGKASSVETEIVRKFKESDYILCDKQLKERIINLISYVDYEIFKLSVRNSSQIPDDIIRKSVMMLVEFSGFDYISAFIAFIKDEISDLAELIPLISNEDCQKIFSKKVMKLLTELTYSNDVANQIFNTTFWNSFLALESSLFEILKDNGVEKEKIKIRLIDRMNISTNESEVLVLPKTCAYIALISLFSKIHDEKILVMLKLMKNLSNDVTYKEIYFLLLLFEIIEVVQNTSNELFEHIKKYIEKYPYDRNSIMEKKNHVMNSFNKEYVVAFALDDYKEEIIKKLEELNIDFKVDGDNVLINSFYFNGLNNVLDSLQLNTKNSQI